jgi:hypothetical protein
MVFAMLVATAAVEAQMDACGADLRTFLPSPFSSSRLHCSPVWNNFILRVPFPFLPSNIDYPEKCISSKNWSSIYKRRALMYTCFPVRISQS